MQNNHQLLRKAVSDVTNEVSKLGQDLETIVELEEAILQAECECCGHTEDCTKDYISRVQSLFSGKWVCGLCAEAVKERLRCPRPAVGVEEAVINHKSFVQDFNTTTRLNPKLSLTWAMRDIAKKNCEKRNNLSKIIRTSSCVPRIDYDTKQ